MVKEIKIILINKLGYKFIRYMGREGHLLLVSYKGLMRWSMIFRMSVHGIIHICGL